MTYQCSKCGVWLFVCFSTFRLIGFIYVIAFWGGDGEVCDGKHVQERTCDLSFIAPKFMKDDYCQLFGVVR